MKLNIKPTPIHTHEGGRAQRINAEQQLRRSVMACLLWEDQFYEDGVSIAKRISDGVKNVSGATAATIAREARKQMHLRHVPLLIAREMARLPSHREYVGALLEDIIERPDELTEYLAIYWKDGRQPLSKQSKTGLAAAFTKFDAYQLAKYNRDGQVKLRDVLFLSHAKPKDEEQKALWERLINGTLESPDTWEVSLSAGANKKATWERLISERKLGGLATLRNLRNMEQAGLSKQTIKQAISQANFRRVLPFRFIAAAKHAPQYEPDLEEAMFRAIADFPKFGGRTVLLVDVSGSMQATVSGKSEISRVDAACGVAMLLREVCEDVEIVVFGTNYAKVPPRRGFALRDIIQHANVGWATNLGHAALAANQLSPTRSIIITDEQSRDRVQPPVGKGYMVNVASYQNGVGYGPWTHIDGWSEAIVRYIQEIEA